MFYEHLPLQIVLFFTIYCITGAVSLLAALYLLLRRGNAFAPDVTPPLRLRRWAASFFAIIALGHIWWFLFYLSSDGIFSEDELFHSSSYVAVVMLDYVTMQITIAGTLLAMLQDRRRPVWPVIAAMVPFVVMGVALMVKPSELLIQIASIYVVLVYVLFMVYVGFAVRHYGRWLLDNYADLERKEVWLTLVLSLVFMLLIMSYTFMDMDTPVILYLGHVLELAIVGLLLWRVETLPCLKREGSDYTQDGERAEELSTPLAFRRGLGNEALAQIELMLKELCVDKQLYLQNDLTLQQLAQAIGTNRSYLSQYFSRQGITYNTYINNLRINHFINLYQELAAADQPIVAQELAQESGFRSYSTFGRAFMQRTGQSVTAWMRDAEG